MALLLIEGLGYPREYPAPPDPPDALQVYVSLQGSWVAVVCKATGVNLNFPPRVADVDKGPSERLIRQSGAS